MKTSGNLPKREIKFRAWDPVGRKMIMPSEILRYKFADFIGNWQEEGAKTIFLQQYTGLKDKNGIGIYEGDIVSDKFDAQIGVVIFEENILEDGTAKRQGSGFFSSNYDVSLYECEVIGNIYETPELLESK